jgi:hypothetical protein
MIVKKLAPILVMAAFVAGCAKPAPTADQVPPSDYAKSTKASVLSFVKSAKEDTRKNPKAAGTRAETYLESLQGAATYQTGEAKQICEDLVKKCKEVVESAKRSPGEVGKKLDEMAALANKLPG